MICGKGDRWRIQIRRGRICRKALKRRLRGGFGWGFYRLRMTQQQYSRFENGKFELNYEQIIFICRLYDVSADFLFGLSEY